MHKIIAIASKTLAALALMFLLAYGNHAYAQQNSAQSTISVFVGDGVKISNVDDWFLGAYSANHTMGTAPRFDDEQCVFSSTGTFSLSVVGLNSTNQLRMINSNGDTIRYRSQMIYYRGTRQRRVNFNRPRTVTRITGASTTDCTDTINLGWNIRFSTWVYAGSFNAAPPGIYQDTISITVIPE